MVLRLNRSCITFSLLYHLEITTFNIKLYYSLKGKLFSSHRCHKFHKAMSLVQNLNPKEALWDMADKKDLQHENAADDSEGKEVTLSSQYSPERIFTTTCGISDMMS